MERASGSGTEIGLAGDSEKGRMQGIPICPTELEGMKGPSYIARSREEHGKYLSTSSGNAGLVVEDLVGRSNSVRETCCQVEGLVLSIRLQIPKPHRRVDVVLVVDLLRLALAGGVGDVIGCCESILRYPATKIDITSVKKLR